MAHQVFGKTVSEPGVVPSVLGCHERRPSAPIFSSSRPIQLDLPKGVNVNIAEPETLDELERRREVQLAYLSDQELLLSEDPGNAQRESTVAQARQEVADLEAAIAVRLRVDEASARRDLKRAEEALTKQISLARRRLGKLGKERLAAAQRVDSAMNELLAAIQDSTSIADQMSDHSLVVDGTPFRFANRDGLRAWIEHRLAGVFPYGPWGADHEGRFHGTFAEIETAVVEGQMP